VQRSTSAFQRIAIWLGVVLLLAATTPHLHLGHLDEHPPGDPGAACDENRGSDRSSPVAAGHDDIATTSTISSDDHHDQHSPMRSIEAHPCSLCRGSHDLPIDRTRPMAGITGSESIANPGVRSPHGPTSSFASLHPARAPPLLPFA
jgi:hypothetical protein